MSRLRLNPFNHDAKSGGRSIRYNDYQGRSSPHRRRAILSSVTWSNASIYGVLCVVVLVMTIFLNYGSQIETSREILTSTTHKPLKPKTAVGTKEAENTVSYLKQPPLAETGEVSRTSDDPQLRGSAAKGSGDESSKEADSRDAGSKNEFGTNNERLVNTDEAGSKDEFGTNKEPRVNADDDAKNDRSGISPESSKAAANDRSQSGDGDSGANLSTSEDLGVDKGDLPIEAIKPKDDDTVDVTPENELIEENHDDSKHVFFHDADESEHEVDTSSGKMTGESGQNSELVSGIENSQVEVEETIDTTIVKDSDNEHLLLVTSERGESNEVKAESADTSSGETTGESGQNSELVSGIENSQVEVEETIDTTIVKDSDNEHVLLVTSERGESNEVKAESADTLNVKENDRSENNESAVEGNDKQPVLPVAMQDEEREAVDDTDKVEPLAVATSDDGAKVIVLSRKKDDQEKETNEERPSVDPEADSNKNMKASESNLLTNGDNSFESVEVEVGENDTKQSIGTSSDEAAEVNIISKPIMLDETKAVAEDNLTNEIVSTTRQLGPDDMSDVPTMDDEKSYFDAVHSTRENESLVFNDASMDSAVSDIITGTKPDIVTKQEVISVETESATWGKDGMIDSAGGRDVHGGRQKENDVTTSFESSEAAASEETSMITHEDSERQEKEIPNDTFDSEPREDEVRKEGVLDDAKDNVIQTEEGRQHADEEHPNSANEEEQQTEDSEHQEKEALNDTNESEPHKDDVRKEEVLDDSKDNVLQTEKGKEHTEKERPDIASDKEQQTEEVKERIDRGSPEIDYESGAQTEETAYEAAPADEDSENKKDDHSDEKVSDTD